MSDDFFEKNGEVVIENSFHEFTVEELYQAIKERLKKEIMVDVVGSIAYGKLID